MTVQTKFLYVNRDQEAEVELLYEYLNNGWRVVSFQSSVEEIVNDQGGNTRKHEVVEWYYHLEKTTEQERGTDHGTSEGRLSRPTA